MMFLWTLFSISLFAVIYMIGIKMLEHRLGKKIFLPNVVHEQDVALHTWYRRNILALRRASSSLVQKYSNIVYQTIRYYVYQLWQRRHLRGTRELVRKDQDVPVSFEDADHTQRQMSQ